MATESEISPEQLVIGLVSWIKDRVAAAGCKGVVLGLSGGLDSSVLAVICQRAFPESTLGLMMPCYSNSDDMAHARLVASRFSIPVEQLVLDPVFDSLLSILPEGQAETEINQKVHANLKARLRMTTLYYFANKFGYLVAGSSNRSELAVGYFTKYGDGGTDIIPLGNLVKEEVVELAHFLGIPREIINKPPSAGLWPGQTDEADFGFTYRELDQYLLSGETESELKSKIKLMMVNSEHKRSLPPIAEINY